MSTPTTQTSDELAAPAASDDCHIFSLFGVRRYFHGDDVKLPQAYHLGWGVPREGAEQADLCQRDPL
ncbi:hypothetical protein PF003_g21092 [Phytophthora fragariae]|nr:hypothetical protein PF003_g21092 [Phytophthora fragariae]